jgi:hypothetical protein
MLRLRLLRILLTIAVLLVIYAAGIVVRNGYGIGVVVRNESKETLHGVSVKVDYRGNRYPLPDLLPGQRVRIFVKAAGESSIKLESADSKNVQHAELLAGYFEDGYCGTTTAIIHSPALVEVQDDTFGIACWKSWFEFL